ncbi:hypothetical protein A9404_01765 [Halothiobacillus diazotrophicus]|uniref:Uncharacterized protein n=2 Tax=Halothiobacillus diazotrophicus TaxID=1860122 RepID=A0A191ZEG9_9GAMM|nr:hypothetical protein A9404_01765 [Halothiobacillus diazotrophicus]
MSHTTDEAGPVALGNTPSKRPITRFIPRILFILFIGGAIAGSFCWYWPAKHEVKRVYAIVHDIRAAAAQGEFQAADQSGQQGKYAGLTLAKGAELGIGKGIGSPVWVNQWGGHIEVKPVQDGARFQLMDNNLPARACSDLAVIDTAYNLGKRSHTEPEAPFAVWINGAVIRAWGGALDKWGISKACNHSSNTVTLELK